MSADYDEGFNDGFDEAANGWGYKYALHPEQWAEDVEKVARALTPKYVDPDAMGKLQSYDGGSTDCGWKAWETDAERVLNALGYTNKEA